MARNKDVAPVELFCCVCGEDYQPCEPDAQGEIARGHACVRGQLICIGCTRAAVQWFDEVQAEAMQIVRAATPKPARRSSSPRRRRIARAANAA